MQMCPSTDVLMANPALAGFAIRRSIMAGSFHSIMSDTVYCITSLKASASTGGNSGALFSCCEAVGS